MKQQSIFCTAEKDSSSDNWKLYIDGAARNNPGPAGVGIYLLKDGTPVEKKGFFVGSKTNNQAEYLALILGLYYVKWHVDAGSAVHIISDSQLLVRQLEGSYRIKNEGLKPLYTLAQKWMHEYHCTLMHIMREENIVADSLANIGIDKRTLLPNDVVDLLEQHDIKI